MPYKKLIETAVPVSKINTETEREKTARNGMPSNVHIWWTRDPMAVVRTSIFESLVDDPAEHLELFPSQDEQDTERQRLLRIAESLSEIESADSKDILELALKEIQRNTSGQLPTVFDPFVGGGTIPVEAHRLGLKSQSSDLNAVAGMITTVVSDVPSRFSDTVPVHPRTEMTLDIAFPGASGFAEDVRYYGEKLQEKAFQKVGYLYPKVKDPESDKELDVSAWIWARTVKCPNPSCGCNIPLSSSYDLAKKRGSEAWVEPVVEDGIIRFKMHREPNPGGKLKPKVAQTAVFKCPACGEITPDAYVKECGIKHNIDSQLIAVVADDGKKRLYLEATPEQESAAQVNAPKNVPHGDLPNFPKRFSPPSFGLTDYADLFTNRQLVFITSMMDLAKEMQSDIEKDALEKGFADDGITFADGGCGALAYAEAVRIALILTISKLLDRCSNICSWSTSSGGSLRNVFSRAAMPMIWDYAEGNPFAGAGGSFANALSRTCDTLALLPAGVDGITKVADAVMPNDVKDAMIVTTLPYYDRASYSDLSDFFYVWMKYGLGDLYPAYFSGDISPKQEDMTAFSHRYGGDKKKADMIYGESLAVAMKNLYVSASADYPSLVGFIYKGNNSSDNEELSEWEYFIDAVCNAGFSVTASWPLGRKYEESIELAESRGIPVTVVLRKKEEDSSQITRRSFVAAVKREVPTLIEETSSKVGIMDLRASVVGQALNIYTRNKQVLDADGSSMKPHMASRIIEQEIDTLISAYYEEASKAVSEEETDHGRES